MSETQAARVGDRHDCPKHGGGPIVTGSTNVFVNTQPFAHIADRASCGGPSDYLVTGAAKVTVNGQKASRVTSHCMHGGKVAAGSPNVLVGGPEGGGTLGKPDSAKKACKDLSKGRVKKPGENPDQQDFSNCGIESSRLLMHQATGSNIAEIPLLDQAIALGDASVHKENGITTSMGGSTLTGQRDLLSKNGVATQSVPATPDNISQAVADGQGVISHHDIGPLWQTTQKGGHAINATGLNYDDNGNLKSVTTVDSGIGSCARDVPAGDYFQSMNVGGFKNAIVDLYPRLEMSAVFLTAKEILEHAMTALDQPVGGIAASIPIAVGRDKVSIGIFFYRELPIPKKLVVYPPQFLILLDPERGTVIRAAAIEPREIGPDAPKNEPLPRHPDEVREDPKLYWERHGRLYDIFHEAWWAYAEGRVRFDRTLHARLVECLDLFDAVAEKRLLPWYEGMAGPFLTWLRDARRAYRE